MNFVHISVENTLYFIKIYVLINYANYFCKSRTWGLRHRLSFSFSFLLLRLVRSCDKTFNSNLLKIALYV